MYNFGLITLKKMFKYGRILQYMEKFMKEAIKEACKAYEKGDVPIGAVIVLDDEIIGRGHNRVREKKDPTAHAEMIAIEEACREIGYERLYQATMYVTCEPCLMCTGASILARLKKIVIGTLDEKTGACFSKYSLARENQLNHQIQLEEGLLKEECKKLLQDFFREIRESKRRSE